MCIARIRSTPVTLRKYFDSSNPQGLPPSYIERTSLRGKLASQRGSSCDRSTAAVRAGETQKVPIAATAFSVTSKLSSSLASGRLTRLTRWFSTFTSGAREGNRARFRGEHAPPAPTQSGVTSRDQAHACGTINIVETSAHTYNGRRNPHFLRMASLQ